MDLDIRKKNYLFKEISQNKLMSEQQSLQSFGLIDHLPIVISTITGCVSISAFVSLVGIPIGITNSVIRLTICAITA